MTATRASWTLGHGLGTVLAAVILITWPTTTALRLVVLLCGSLALLPWTVARLRHNPRSPWWAWSPLALGASVLAWSLISALGSGAPWALSLYGWYGRDNGILMLLGVAVLLLTGAALRRNEVLVALWWVIGASSLAALVSIAQALGWDVFANPLGYGGEPSLLGNPNFAAAFFAITTLVSLGLAFQPDASRRMRMSGVGAASLQVVGLVLAGSQQGPVALVAGGIAGALLFGMTSDRAVVKRVSAAVGALVASAAIAIGALALAGVGSLGALLRSDTLAIRLEYWKASWSTMLGLPVFGTGPDGLGRYIAEFRPESYVALLGTTTRVDAAHNVALHFGATLGVIGFALWLAFAISTTCLLAWRAWTWQVRGNGGSPVLLATVGAAWIAYLTQSLVSIDMTVLMALGWSLAGMSVAIASDTASRPRPITASARAESAKRANGTAVEPKRGLAIASAALALIGASIALPGYLAERDPSISTIDEARTAMASSMTPCTIRLTIAGALASQVDLPAYQTLMEAAVAADPRCPPLMSIYADAALQAGNLDAAGPASLRAVEYDPLDYQAWLLRAQVLNALGDAQAASQAYAEAVRIASFTPGSDSAALARVAEALGIS